MAGNTKKQTVKGQESKSNWASIRFEIAFYIVWRSIVSLFKGIFFTLVPAADRRAGGRFSFFIHSIFAIVTLEGPRLMLISRYHASRMKKGTKLGLSAVSGTAVAAIVIATVIVSSQLMAVTIDGKVVGYVENEEQYVSLLQQAKAKISAQVGTENSEILIQDTNVSLEPVIAPQQAPLTLAEPAVPADSGVDAGDEPPADPGDSQGIIPDEGSDAALSDEDALVDTLIGALTDSSAIKATVYTITINDQVMATLGSLPDASEVLSMIRDWYRPESEGEYTGKILDDVSINSVTTMLDSVDVQKPKDVFEFLLAGKTDYRSYTALEGDSIGNICGALGLLEEELIELYKDYDFDEIALGDVFGTSFITPYIRYETVSIETDFEEVPFETIEENTDTMFLGQRKTVEEGEPGEREVSRSVTRINGEYITSAEINSVIIKEPVPELVKVGTMMVLADAYVGPSDGTGGGGDGALGRPLNSWFLSRSVGAGHSGADMIAPRGTPIFAAASGVVTFAGVYGGYGNIVMIDHGNGLTTAYAHCDTMNVSAGQGVSRGQQIATVGSTGRSSAYHLHFEVRVGGVAQEPMNWIG